MELVAKASASAVTSGLYDTDKRLQKISELMEEVRQEDALATILPNVYRKHSVDGNGVASNADNDKRRARTRSSSLKKVWWSRKSWKSGSRRRSEGPLTCHHSNYISISVISPFQDYNLCLYYKYRKFGGKVIQFVR